MALRLPLACAPRYCFLLLAPSFPPSGPPRATARGLGSGTELSPSPARAPRAPRTKSGGTPSASTPGPRTAHLIQLRWLTPGGGSVGVGCGPTAVVGGTRVATDAGRLLRLRTAELRKSPATTLAAWGELQRHGAWGCPRGPFCSFGRKCRPFWGPAGVGKWAECDTSSGSLRHRGLTSHPAACGITDRTERVTDGAANPRRLAVNPRPVWAHTTRRTARRRTPTQTAASCASSRRAGVGVEALWHDLLYAARARSPQKLQRHYGPDPTNLLR